MIVKRCDDAFMALAYVQAAPAAGKVDKAVTIKILNDRPLALLDDERRVGGKWSSNILLLLGKDSGRLGAGKCGFDTCETPVDHIPPYIRQ